MELQDLLETKAQSMSPEELQVYAPPPLKKVSNHAQQLQIQLNALLLKGEFCDTQDRLEKVAFQVLDHVPDDLTAYHVLVRTSSTRGDFGLTLIAVRLSDRARYYPEQYQYSTEIEVRNTLAYWGHEVFDQSSQRRGRVLDLEVINCHDQTRPATLPEPLALANLPEEFVMKATSIPRLSDLRDFRGLTAAEFQNRLLREVERVSGTEDPHPPSRLPLGPEYTSEAVVVGRFRLDLTEASVWRRAGRVNFRVRLGSNLWQHYRTDRETEPIPFGHWPPNVSDANAFLESLRAAIPGDTQMLPFTAPNVYEVEMPAKKVNWAWVWWNSWDRPRWRLPYFQHQYEG